MKIAINSLSLQIGHKSRGIGFYTKNLISSLRDKGVEVLEFSNIDDVKDADLVHYPFFDLFFPSLKVEKSFKTVVTVHDVIPLIFSKHYPPGLKGRVNLFRQKLSLKKVDAVLTDSICSKKDIHKYLRISLNKIFPVYLASDTLYKDIKDKSLLNSFRLKYNLPSSFGIYVGGVNWNKNLLNLSKSCIELGVDLFLVGRDFEDQVNLDHPERESYRKFLLEYSKNPKIHMLGFVESDDLVKLYNLASFVLLPSFYEGFGLPILEAQACGVPVITSDISSMPEVSGDGAILVNPYNVDDIKQAIKSILENRELRDDLIKKGLENVKRFSWSKVASETIKVYEEVTGKI